MSVSVPLFDANAMVGPLAARGGRWQPERLLATMRMFGVTEALVAHTYAWRHDPAVGNEQLVKELADHDELYPCWVVAPSSCGELPPPGQLLAQADAVGVVAFRMYPHDHGYDPLGHDADALMDRLEDHGAPVLIDADQAGWSSIEELAGRHPSLALLITHTGYRTLRALAGALERHEFLHVDLSYLGSHTGLEWLVARFGASRFVFGTGFPHRDPADAVARLMWSELDDGDVDAIAGGNLRRLLGRSGQRHG